MLPTPPYSSTYPHSSTQMGREKGQTFSESHRFFVRDLEPALLSHSLKEEGWVEHQRDGSQETGIQAESNRK